MKSFIRNLFGPDKTGAKRTAFAALSGLLVAGAILVGGSMSGGGTFVPVAHAWSGGSGSSCAIATGLTDMASDYTPSVGETITYTISGSYAFTATTTVTVTDALGAGLTFVSASPSIGTYSSSTGIWNVGAVNGPNSLSLVITAKVDPGTEGKTIENQPTVSYSRSDCTQSDAILGATITVQGAPVPTSTVQYADLAVAKTVDVATATPGSTVHYSINVTDLGPATSTGVVATDTLPSGLTFVSATTSEGSYASSTGTWTIGTLSASSSATLGITALVNASDTASTTITNTAIVGASASTTDNNLSNNSSSVTFTVVAPTSTPPCSLTAAQFEAAVASGTISWDPITQTTSTASFTITNRTSCSAPISLVSWKMFVAQGQPHWLSTQQQFDLATSSLLASSTQTLTVNLPSCRAQVDAMYGTAPSSLLDSNPYSYPNVPFNLAWLFANTNLPLCGSGTPTSTADYSITKTVDNTAPTVGSTVHYTVTVGNIGSSTVNNAVATDTLPAGLTLVSATTSEGSYASSTGTWTIGALAPSSTATLDVAALVNATDTVGQQITNTATVASDTASVTITVASGGGGITPTATIVATKIICPSVNDLPDLSGTGAHITSSTAAAFLATHPECHAASGWDFQWGNASAADPGASFIGPTTSTNWMAPFGPTNASGTASVAVQNPTTYSQIWMREVLQSGYMTYSYPGTNSSDSPEMFCNTDVLNYDNYDRISNPQNNGTYYCVAWNVPTATSTPTSTVANLAITKTVDNAAPQAGNTVNYTLTVDALGPATSTGVVATDTLPSGLTFEHATASVGSYATSTGTWTIGDMMPSSTATLEIAALVNATDTVGQQITNTAIVGESPSSTNNNVGNSSSSVTITVSGGGSGGGNDAALSIAKTANVTSTLPGGVIDYMITATTGGPNPSTGVVATDTLPSGLTFEHATASVGSYATSTGTWTIGTLAPNATATLEIAALVNASGTANTTIVNQATIGESPTLTNTSHNTTAQASVYVGTPTSTANTADLAITKTVDNASPVTGTDVHFLVTVTNNGPSTATFVYANDQLPIGLALVNATASPSTTYSMGTGVWTIGTLAPNATATLAMETEVSAAAGTQVVNTATVSSTLASLIDPNPANNSSSVTLNVQAAPCTSNCGGGGGGGGGGNIPTAQIGITKTVDNADPSAGAVIHYTLTATASGPSTSFGVVASDTLPAGVTFDSASSSLGSYDPSTGLWTIGQLANGQSATLVITATVNAGDANGMTITNTGTIHEASNLNSPLSGPMTSSVTITVGGTGGGGTVGVGGGGGQVLGASTSTGEVLGASCGLYLTSYIHPVRKNLNDPAQVKKLQTFLNQNLGLDLAVNGDYNASTIAAVNQFQVKYHTEVLAPWVPLGLQTQFTPTGFVYQTTQRWINLIMCPALNLPLPHLVVYGSGN